jgi:hypothetical protein
MIRTLTTTAFAVAMMLTTNAFALAPAKKLAAPAPKVIAQLAQKPTYLEGMTNDKYSTGSNAFARLLKKDGSEEIRANLRLNAGASKEANVPSVAPEKLSLSVFHIANKKTTETVRLNFKGLKASEVGTRVLTFESKAQSNAGPGRMVAKVQQEQTPEKLWKTTGTLVQFVPN